VRHIPSAPLATARACLEEVCLIFTVAIADKFLGAMRCQYLLKQRILFLLLRERDSGCPRTLEAEPHDGH